MDSFWDFFWFIISFFLLMAYLMVLFQIVTDLFRDKDVSGGMKALWVICLIFFPVHHDAGLPHLPRARAWPSVTWRWRKA